MAPGRAAVAWRCSDSENDFKSLAPRFRFVAAPPPSGRRLSSWARLDRQPPFRNFRKTVAIPYRESPPSAASDEGGRWASIPVLQGGCDSLAPAGPPSPLRAPSARVAHATATTVFRRRRTGAVAQGEVRLASPGGTRPGPRRAGLGWRARRHPRRPRGLHTGGRSANRRRGRAPTGPRLIPEKRAGKALFGLPRPFAGGQPASSPHTEGIGQLAAM